MGLVIDEEEARRTYCHGYRMEDGEIIAWSPGVVGSLSDRQEKIYCGKGSLIEPISKAPELEKRIKTFREITHTASEEARAKFEKGKRLPYFLRRVGQLARERGLEI